MLIFNTTFHIEDGVHNECITFLKDVYIPESINGGFLLEPRFAKIHSQHELSGCSYSLQFYVKNIETLNHWLTGGETLLQQKLKASFGEKVLGFVTVMEEVKL